MHRGRYVIRNTETGYVITANDRLQHALEDAAEMMDRHIHLQGWHSIKDAKKDKVLAEGPNAVHMLLEGLFNNK